jgi:outer membrane protein assembly factor BamA
LDTRKESERNGKCADPAEGYKCPSSTQQIAVIGPTLDIDYRDNSFVPTKGTYSRLALEYSHPDLGSSEEIEFARIEGVFNYYLRLGSPKWVWAQSLGGGYVSNLSDRPGSGVPVKYAFFLGGSSTLRGYESNNREERVPNDSELPITGPIDLIIPEDSHYFLYKSELRWSIVGDHGAVLFYDGGRVDVTGYHFEKPYRQSVGVGYRYNTPVGPLRLDIGFKIDRRSVEREYRGHFAIGTF